LATSVSATTCPAKKSTSNDQSCKVEIQDKIVDMQIESKNLVKLPIAADTQIVE
jgi:hypothetical protein